jgi:hypothetical protein
LYHNPYTIIIMVPRSEHWGGARNAENRPNCYISIVIICVYLAPLSSHFLAKCHKVCLGKSREHKLDCDGAKKKLSVKIAFFK